MLFLGGFGRLMDADINSLGYDSNFSSMVEGLPDILIGVVIVPVVSWFAKKIDSNDVDEVFACYNNEVVVSAKDSLGNK